VSRRWRGARPVLAVVDEVAGFRTPDDVDEDAAVLLEKSNARNRELCQENEELRARIQQLKDRRDAEMRRADEAGAALVNQNELLDHKDQIIAALRLEVAELHDNHGATCGDAANSQRWRRVAHELQDRVSQLQAANEGHDRAARGRGK